MSRTTEELIQIAAAGGGFILDGDEKTTDELIQIAGATAESETLLIVRNVGGKTTDELVKIATAGDGSVVFEV